MTAPTDTKAPGLDLHPATAEAVRTGRYEIAAQLHVLAGIRQGAILEHHLLPDGRPQWDTIDCVPLSSGEEVLRDVAWELGGHRPQHGGVICRLSLVDDLSVRRILEAIAIRRPGVSVWFGHAVGGEEGVSA